MSSKTENQPYRFRSKKVQKIEKAFMKFNFLQNVDLQLSKDVPTMFQTLLEQILGSDVVWSKMTKNDILAIFGDNSSSYLGT